MTDGRKLGIVDVGGGTRGIYGAGVFDYLMDNRIHFDYAVGVSAGSANAVSYQAGQRGRNIRFYDSYAFRKEYMSWSNLFRTGSYIDLKYVYGALSNSDGEDPVDFEAFMANRSHKIDGINDSAYAYVDVKADPDNNKAKIEIGISDYFKLEVDIGLYPVNDKFSQRTAHFHYGFVTGGSVYYEFSYHRVVVG